VIDFGFVLEGSYGAVMIDGVLWSGGAIDIYIGVYNMFRSLGDGWDTWGETKNVFL
jgi:hypothetical protein